MVFACPRQSLKGKGTVFIAQSLTLGNGSELYHKTVEEEEWIADLLLITFLCRCFDLIYGK